MKKHVINYLKFYDIGDQDRPICEYCGKYWIVDIHHILFRSKNGKDNIENLIGLCRYCHNKAHSSKEFNNLLKQMKDEEFN